MRLSWFFRLKRIVRWISRRAKIPHSIHSLSIPTIKYYLLNDIVLFTYSGCLSFIMHSVNSFQNNLKELLVVSNILYSLTVSISFIQVVVQFIVC